MTRLVPTRGTRLRALTKSKPRLIAAGLAIESAVAMSAVALHSTSVGAYSYASCNSGGPGSKSCSSYQCSVTCDAGYYACCQTAGGGHANCHCYPYPPPA